MNLVRKKRVLEIPEFNEPKRRKVGDKELKKRQKQFIILLKSLSREKLAQACDLVAQIYPPGVVTKKNGKRTIRPGAVKRTSKIEELMNAIEVMRSTNLSEIPISLRKHREYQLKLEIQNRQVSRLVIVKGGNSLHDISRIAMVLFSWLPRSTPFKWRSNEGQAFGSFECREEINKKMINRTALKNISIAEVFNALSDVAIWKYGDKRIEVSCQGVTPGKDKIHRGLPRCVGGNNPGLPHLDTLLTQWKATWQQEDVVAMNEIFLGDRFVRDGFKEYSEYDVDKSAALRRCAPFFTDSATLLHPFTERYHFFPPMDPGLLTQTWHYTFRVVRKAEVRAYEEIASDFLCGIDVDTRVIADKIHLSTKRAHIISPVNGWVFLRDPKGKRILQEIKHVRDNEESYKF